MDKKQVKGPQGSISVDQVERRAKDILESINKVRSAKNALEEEIHLGNLKNDVTGLMEAWETVELSLGTVDPPE